MPTINTSKSSLQNLLTALLAPANQEQNQSLPPWVFTSFVNTATSFLISTLVKSYPNSPQLVDILDNFVISTTLPVSNGYFSLPANYRDLLGSPYIFANANRDGECGEIPKITTPQEFKTATLKGGCKSFPIVIIPESEFSYRTSSTYNFPTHEAPIGYMAGQKTVKICPYDLSKVALLYVRNEAICNMTYIMNPDDTYFIDPTNPAFQDSEWSGNAQPYLFKALNALYAAYASDPAFSNWSQILSREGII